MKQFQLSTAAAIIGVLVLVLGFPVETFAQEPVRTWRLEDTFNVRKIARGESGRLYVPDRDQHQVLIYDADGNRVQAVGREGKGPGEFQQPLSIALSPDGETFAVCDSNRRVSLFSREGAYQQSFVLPGIVPSASNMEFVSDSLLAIGGLKPVSIYEGTVIHLYTTDGELVQSFFDRTEKAKALNVTVRMGVGFDIHKDRLYAIQPVDYAISVFTLEGTRERTVRVASLPEHLKLPATPQPNPMEDRAGAIQWTQESDALRRLFVVNENLVLITVQKAGLDRRYMDFIDRSTGRVVHSRPFDGWVVDADPERGWIYVAEPQDEPVTLLRAYRVGDLLESG